MDGANHSHRSKTLMPKISLRTLLVIIAVAAIACWMYATFHPFGPLMVWWLLALALGMATGYERRDVFYSSLTWCYVTIRFDKRRTVVEVDHDP